MNIKILNVFMIFLLNQSTILTLVSDDVDLTIVEILTKYGYPVENHTITTPDKYILTTYRIPHGQSSNITNKAVVFLVHGMGGSCENFIATGVDSALSYYLADNGYDVWLFNARGSVHSRKHQIYDPNVDKRYWDFSFHEIGIYDIPTNIDYILNITNQQSLIYIGHSQGTTTYFVMLSEKPEYNSKIKLSVQLAPSIVYKYISIPVVKLFSSMHSIIENFLYSLNIYEIFPNSLDFINATKAACGETLAIGDLCTHILYSIGGWNSQLINKSLIPFIFSKGPSGYSVRQGIHYIQGIASGYFRQYDFGAYGNLKKYNRTTPPLYNVQRSTAPLALFYSATDWFVPKEGLKIMVKVLNNVVLDYEVPYNPFGHIDFIFANNVLELINKPVYNLLEKYSNK